MNPYRKFISNLRIGLELSIIWTTTMASDETSVFVFDWVLMSNVWVYNAPQVGVVEKWSGYG